MIRTLESALRCAVLSAVLSSIALGGASAQLKGPVKETPQAAVTQQAEACYAGYGLEPAEKIKICSDVLAGGTLSGLPLALAYFSRGQASGGMGNQAGSIGDYKQALRLFNDVIRTSAPNGAILFQRGLIYHTMGDADQAIIDYSDSIRIDPNQTYAYVARGTVLYTKKDNNEGAIHDFDTALKLNKCEITAWINRGLVYKRKGNLDQSISDFTTAIACMPANAGPVRPMAEIPAGTVLNAAYFQGVGQASQLADAYYQRGLVYLDRAGKERKQAKAMLEKAIADFTTAIRVNPTAEIGRAHV